MSETRRTAELSWGNGGRIVFADFELDPGAPVQYYLKDVAGWFGGVGVKGDNTDRSLGHGVFPEPSTLAGRELTLSAEIWCAEEADRDRLNRLASGILGDGDFGTLRVTEDGLTLSATVKLAGEVGHSTAGSEWLALQLPLLAPDPFLYADPATVQLNPPGTGRGLVFPLFPDGVLSYGDVAGGSGGVLRNSGNAEAFPVFTVRGTFPQGFALVAGGRTVEYLDPVFPQSPVTVDMAAGSVVVNGRDNTARTSRRGWFSVPPGGVIAPRILPRGGNGSGWADAVISSTYK